MGEKASPLPVPTNRRICICQNTTQFVRVSIPFHLIKKRVRRHASAAEVCYLICSMLYIHGHMTPAYLCIQIMDVHVNQLLRLDIQDLQVSTITQNLHRNSI